LTLERKAFSLILGELTKKKSRLENVLNLHLRDGFLKTEFFQKLD